MQGVKSFTASPSSRDLMGRPGSKTVSPHERQSDNNSPLPSSFAQVRPPRKSPKPDLRISISAAPRRLSHVVVPAASPARSVETAMSAGDRSPISLPGRESIRSTPQISEIDFGPPPRHPQHKYRAPLGAEEPQDLMSSQMHPHRPPESAFSNTDSSEVSPLRTSLFDDDIQEGYHDTPSTKPGSTKKESSEPPALPAPTSPPFTSNVYSPVPSAQSHRVR